MESIANDEAPTAVPDESSEISSNLQEESHTTPTVQPTDDVTEESPNIAITSATLEEAPVTESREVEAPAADDVAVQDGVGVGVVMCGVEETLGEGVESSTVEEDVETSEENIKISEGIMSKSEVIMK